MRGAIPPLPNTTSWRGSQLKKQGQFYLISSPLLIDKLTFLLFNCMND